MDIFNQLDFTEEGNKHFNDYMDKEDSEVYNGNDEEQLKPSMTKLEEAFYDGHNGIPNVNVVLKATAIVSVCLVLWMCRFLHGKPEL